MSEIVGDSSLIKYSYNGHTWYEIYQPTHITDNGKGGYTYVSAGEGALMTLPGSGTTAVRCFVNINVYVRVNENLDTEMKITPLDVESGWRGIYFNQMRYGTSLDSTPVGNNSSNLVHYPMLFAVYTDNFALKGRVGSKSIDLCSYDGSTVGGVIKYDLQNTYSNPSKGLTIVHKKKGSEYGRSDCVSSGRILNWKIGYGGSVDTVDEGSRWSGNSLSNSWMSSSGWFPIGNLERNFHWASNEEDFNGYIYMCGSGYYTNVSIDYGTAAVAKRITIPGLKRLLDYYPWAICKSGKWYSCNRPGGHLKSGENKRMSNGRQVVDWVDRKNRPYDVKR